MHMFIHLHIVSSFLLFIIYTIHGLWVHFLPWRYHFTSHFLTFHLQISPDLLHDSHFPHYRLGSLSPASFPAVHSSIDWILDVVSCSRRCHLASWQMLRRYPQRSSSFSFLCNWMHIFSIIELSLSTLVCNRLPLWSIPFLIMLSFVYCFSSSSTFSSSKQILIMSSSQPCCGRFMMSISRCCWFLYSSFDGLGLAGLGTSALSQIPMISCNLVLRSSLLKSRTW